jgi:hypothetical protein
VGNFPEQTVSRDRDHKNAANKDSEGSKEHINGNIGQKV